MIRENARAAISARSSIAAWLLYVFAASFAPGCVTASAGAGTAAGTPSLKCYEGLALPNSFHWAKESGSPESWAVIGYEKLPNSIVFPVVRRAEYRPDQDAAQNFNSASEYMTVQVGLRPSVPVKSFATQAENKLDAQCPSAVGRTEVHATSNEYLVDDKLDRCGSEPRKEFVVRYLYDGWGYQVLYARVGRWLEPVEREQAVALVSSFMITSCQAPNCPQMFFSGVPQSCPGGTP